MPSVNSFAILVGGVIFLLVGISIVSSIMRKRRERRAAIEQSQKIEDQKHFIETFQEPLAIWEIPQEVINGKPAAFISMKTAFSLVARPVVERLPCMVELEINQKPMPCPAFGNSTKILWSRCKECTFHRAHAQEAVALWLDSLGKVDLLHLDIGSIARMVTADIGYLEKRVFLKDGKTTIYNLNKLRKDWAENLFNKDAYAKVFSFSPYYFGDKSGLDSDLVAVADLKREYMEKLSSAGEFEKSRAFFLPKLIDVFTRLEDLLTRQKADTDKSLITDLDLDGLAFVGIPNWNTEKIFSMVQRFHQLLPEEMEELTPVVNEILQATFLYARHSRGELNNDMEKALEYNYFYKNFVSGDEQ